MEPPGCPCLTALCRRGRGGGPPHPQNSQHTPLLCRVGQALSKSLHASPGHPCPILAQEGKATPLWHPNRDPSRARRVRSVGRGRGGGLLVAVKGGEPGLRFL